MVTWRRPLKVAGSAKGWSMNKYLTGVLAGALAAILAMVPACRGEGGGAIEP